MIIRSLLILTCFLLSPPLYAEDENDDYEDAPANKAALAEKAAKPQHIKIPEELRGGGWTLVIDGRAHSLDGEEIQTEVDNDQATVKLLDRRGRIANYQSTDIDSMLLDTLRPRPWRLGMHAGVTSGDPKVWNKVFVSESHGNFGIDLLYQPSALGLLIDYSTISSHSRLDNGITSAYITSQVNLGMSYEWAPWTRGSSALSNLHIATLLGGSWGSHKVVMNDSEVKISDRAQSMGPFWGLDLRLPLVGNFWVNMRYTHSFLPIKLPAFGVKTTKAHRHLTWGGAYAF